MTNDAHTPANFLRIIYASLATSPYDLQELLGLLVLAQSKNAELGISGMLVYEGGAFLQILEGDSEAVRRLYAEIEADPRHTGVRKLVEEQVDRLAFGDWSMGFVRVAREDLLSIPGCNDFFATGASLSDIDLDRARVVLEKFREAKWHKKAG